MMNFNLLLSLSVVAILAACSSPEPSTNKSEPPQEVDTAQWVIQKSIERYGGPVDSVFLSFTFRDINYSGNFLNGRYVMTRDFIKDGDFYLDSLTNDTFKRSIDEQPTTPLEDKAQAYSNSINSVFYFALLPFKLSDPAVIAQYKGTDRIGQKQYYRIAVSFEQEGGGEDHEDLFTYWINREDWSLDFFAYSYKTEGGGMRFRSVSGTHETESGHLLQDYINYKPASDSVKFADLFEEFKKGKLLELSRIELEEVKMSNLAFEEVTD